MNPRAVLLAVPVANGARNTKLLVRSVLNLLRLRTLLTLLYLNYPGANFVPPVRVRTREVLRQQTGRNISLVFVLPVPRTRIEKLAPPLVANVLVVIILRFPVPVLAVNARQTFDEHALESPQTTVIPAVSPPLVTQLVDVSFRPGLEKYTWNVPLHRTSLIVAVDGASRNTPLERALLIIVA